MTLGNIAWITRRQGNYRRAASVDRERLAINRQLANREQLADCCQVAAEVAARLGQPERGARLAAAAARVRAKISRQVEPSYQRQMDALEAKIQSRLGRKGFLEEWTAGRAIPLDEAIDEADAVFADEEAAPDFAASQPVTNVAVATGLTPREVEVLRLIAKDWSNQQIADALFLSRRTVHKHVENILAKLGTDSRAGAAVWAVRHGLD